MAERSPKVQNSVNVFCDASAFTPEEAAEVFDAALRASSTDIEPSALADLAV